MASIPTGAAVLRPEKTDAIIRAVFAELADKGWAQMTVDAVAARAGVGKPALYRRWRSKDEMILRCVIDAGARAALPSDTGSLRDDLLGFARQATEYLADPCVARVVAAVLAAMSIRPDLAKGMHDHFRAPRRAATSAAFARALDRGEINPRADVELATDLLAGPLYMYALGLAGPVPQGYAERLTDAVLSAVGCS